MSLATWLTTFSPFFDRTAKPLPGVRSVEQFRQLLDHERTRADRGPHVLSLLLLDLSGSSWKNSAAKELLLAITARVRRTDVVGWFDRQVIGVLMPDTHAEGAHKLAADLQAMQKGVPTFVPWRVYTYPEQWRPEPGESANQRNRPTNQRRSVKSRAHTSVASAQSPSSFTNAAHPTRAFHGHVHSDKDAGLAVLEPLELSADTAAVSRAANGMAAAARTEMKAESLQTLFIRKMPLSKRAIDVVGSGLGLVLLSPVLLAASGAIKLTSPGPVFFKQKRSGLGGKTFDICKFRTMCVDAEERKKDLEGQNELSGPVFKMSNDPRVTAVGKFLRKTSIDELPQLWNVLKGDMSLVGPRPPLPDEVRQYDAWQRRRLELTGGMTCIWQVSGRNEVGFEDWVRMDLRYAEQQSLALDLAILARTIPAVISGRGAR